MNVFVDLLKFHYRTINRKSLHENRPYSSQESIGLISLSFEWAEWEWTEVAEFLGIQITLIHLHFLYKEEWWNSIYFNGPFSISLALFFGSWSDTLIVNILLLNHQCWATYMKDSIYSVIALKSTRKQNLFTYICFCRASLLSLSSFVSYLN